MIKQFFFIILIISSNILIAQKYVDVTIVNKANDTIHSKMKVQRTLFNSKNIDIRSFYKTINLVDNDLNVKQKIMSYNIKELIINDESGKDFIFINRNGLLNEVLFNGKKIKWLRSFNQNLYDGSLSSTDYIITENDEAIKLGGLGSKRKKTLKEITKSKPELAPKIDELDTYNIESMTDFLLKYQEN